MIELESSYAEYFMHQMCIRDRGGAAQWVTIVLFAEIAKRSFIPLKKQEIYILFYVTGGLMAVASTGGGAGGAFGGMIWNQYFVQAPQAGEKAKMIPHWGVRCV